MYFVSYRSMGFNPLQCDCRLRWLPSLLQPRGSIFITGNCENLGGADIDSLTEDQLVCGGSVLLLTLSLLKCPGEFQASQNLNPLSSDGHYSGHLAILNFSGLCISQCIVLNWKALMLIISPHFS